MKHCTLISRNQMIPARAANITLKQQRLGLVNDLVDTIGNIADVSIQSSSYIKSIGDDDDGDDE